MEQALYISRTESLSCWTEDFTRLYFGQEFCERLLPSETDVEKAADFAEKHKAAFTFLTPYVTNRGLERVGKLVGAVCGIIPEPEVVFNDWGVCQMLSEEFGSVLPVLGRLLNKMKRGPRIMNILEQLPPETRAYYTGSNLDVPDCVDFLKSKGIQRVEFDNVLQEAEFEGFDRSIKRSLHMPYAFVSTTRFCLTAGCADPGRVDRVGVFPCGKECRDVSFVLNNPVMGRPLIRRGNSIFFMNESIPEAVSCALVDRIVIAPEIPL